MWHYLFAEFLATDKKGGFLSSQAFLSSSFFFFALKFVCQGPTATKHIDRVLAAVPGEQVTNLLLESEFPRGYFEDLPQIFLSKNEGAEAGVLCRNMFNARCPLFWSRGKVVALEKLGISSPGPKKLSSC